MHTPSRDPDTIGPLATVRDAAQDTAEAVADGAHRVGQALDSRTRDISDAAAQQAARISHGMRDWLDRQGDTAKHMASAVRREASAVAESGQRYVRDEPVKSVLIAAATGALVTGLLMLLQRRR